MTPAALVVAGAPAGRLDEVLIRRTVAWAVEHAPGRTLVAAEPPEAVEGLLARGAEAVALGPLGASVRAAFERLGGPLMVVTTRVPRLGPSHAAAALLDLREGADASFGPTQDGGWYLAALAAWRPQLAFEDELAPMLEAAHAAGLEVGLLRMERALNSPKDAAAMLADPLLPAEIRSALQAA